MEPPALVKMEAIDREVQGSWGRGAGVLIQ